MTIPPDYRLWTEADYAVALDRVDALMGCAPGSPESVELDALATQVERYEEDDE